MGRGLERPPRWAVVVMVLVVLAIAGGYMLESRQGHADPLSREDLERMDAAAAAANASRAAQSAAEAAENAPPAVTPTVNAAFANGRGVPQVADTGQQLGVYDNGRNASGLKVADGRLSHGKPTDDNAAGYLEAALPGAPTVIGAEATFREGGSIALIFWQNSIVGERSAGRDIANGGVHFVATPTGWHLGVWDSAAGAEEVLYTEPFATPLDAGGATPYRFQVTRDGDRAWVQTPNGLVGPITDPRIAEWSGPWACWELYEFQPTATPASLVSVWAG